MKTQRCLDTSVSVYPLTQRHIKCDPNPKTRACSNLEQVGLIVFFFLRRYSFIKVLAFSTNSLHLGQFLLQSFQLFIVMFITPFLHHPPTCFWVFLVVLLTWCPFIYFLYHSIVWHKMYVSEPS
jgi:hypothetical protein